MSLGIGGGSGFQLILHFLAGSEFHHFALWNSDIDTRILGVSTNAFLPNLNLEDAKIAQLHRVAIDKGITNCIKRVGNDIRNLRLMKFDIRLDGQPHPGGQIPLRYGVPFFVGRIHIPVG